MYYEKLGGIDVEALKREGVEPKALLWHYMYQVKHLHFDTRVCMHALMHTLYYSAYTSLLC